MNPDRTIWSPGCYHEGPLTSRTVSGKMRPTLVSLGWTFGE